MTEYRTQSGKVLTDADIQALASHLDPAEGQERARKAHEAHAFVIPEKAQQEIQAMAGLEGPITWFGGDYAFLGSFYGCVIEYRGEMFASAEHAFHWAKTDDPKWRAAIRQAPSAREAKRLGRWEMPQSVVRPGWDEKRISVMEEIVLAKFTQHAALREKLLATGDRDLIEGNSHGDTFWGVCKGEGENWLGKILMRTRTYLRGL